MTGIPVTERPPGCGSLPTGPQHGGMGFRVALLGMGWFPDQPGGLNRYLVGLHRALREQGARPLAIVLGPMEHPTPGVTVAGSSHDPLPVRLWRYQAAVRRELGNFAGAVDVHFALYGLLPLLAGPLRSKPLVVHFHGPWVEESLATGDRRRLVLASKWMTERAVYLRATELVVLSMAFKRVLVERYKLDPWRVRVLPPGVELDQFRLGDRNQARAALGIHPERWVALTVRRLIPRMGVDMLLDAWANQGVEGDDALLLIAGDGPSRSELEAQAAALGVTSQVHFLGRVGDDELVALYQAADVCVVPTVSLEGFGLVVLEALACGTPVVTTDAGGLPEALGALDPSLVVAAGDPAALATRLLTARDGTHPLPTRETCRRYAEGFAWPRVAERTLQVYQRATHPEPRRDLRVVYLDHCAQLSGGEVALLRLLPALPDVEPHVILGQDGPLATRLMRAGVSVEILPMAEPARGMRRYRVTARRMDVAGVLHAAAHTARLSRRLRQLQPDLVHANSLKAALYGGIAARLAGVPAIWHVRDRIASDYLPPEAVRLVRALARHLPTAIIANSETTLATLKLDSVPAGVISSACPDPVAPSEFCPRGTGPLRIGMVGRLAPWKGQDVFLRGFAAAFPAGDERAVVVGEALFGEQAYADSLRRLATELRVDGRVQFAGFREDVTDVLKEVDVLVHASVIPEPFGLVVVEGMAAGLAVVAAGAGGPAEVITHGVDGLLYEPGNIEELAAALRRLANDTGLRARLGEQARRRAAAFAPAAIGQLVVGFYRQVLSGGDHGRGDRARLRHSTRRR
jgi:glycosyltransferase involved in cell wall biosynthesis